ncbi:hypothetical protein ACQ86E_01460 [Bradyrhizobium betae]|uniref:hypothetical protein n=1 Tax=Bradyrhizobium betae TaxID=244734 RepID=UPI003D67A6E1
MSHKRVQRGNEQGDGENGGECRRREINEQDRGIERELEEGIFLETRRAEVERKHGQHRDAHGRAGMIDQPAIQSRKKRFSFPQRPACDRAKDGQGERHQHQREGSECVGREDGRLAATEAGMGHEVPHQQQQRRIELEEIDDVLVGNLAGHRKLPAGEQIGVPQPRYQDRQCEAERRHRNQHQLAAARQRQEIQRSQHGKEHQLERHHEAEQRSAGQMQQRAAVLRRSGGRQRKQEPQRDRGQDAA